MTYDDIRRSVGLDPVMQMQGVIQGCISPTRCIGASPVEQVVMRTQMAQQQPAPMPGMMMPGNRYSPTVQAEPPVTTGSPDEPAGLLPVSEEYSIPRLKRKPKGDSLGEVGGPDAISRAKNPGLSSEGVSVLTPGQIVMMGKYKAPV